MTPAEAPSIFATTRWSRVFRAVEKEGLDDLAGLCRDYWKPLFHFARRRGHSLEDAQDLTQGFFEQLLQTSTLARADRERGQFRTFLLTAFTRYLTSEHRARNAAKRGGGQQFFVWDPELEESYRHELGDDLTPELQFDRSWAQALMAQTTERLAREYSALGRQEIFAALRPLLVGGEQAPAQAEIGRRLRLSEGGVASALHRMRRRYGELLRAAVADTVSTPEEVEEELRHLRRVLTHRAGA